MSANKLRERRRVAIDFSNEKSLTEQHHKESCDIHFIMRQAERTGILEHVNKYGGQYMEYISAPDFQSDMNAIARANEMFESIPSKIRKRFGNDPAEFLAFIQEEKNRDEMLKLGFSDSHLPPLPPEPEPAKVQAPEPPPQD